MWDRQRRYWTHTEEGWAYWSNTIQGHVWWIHTQSYTQYPSIHRHQTNSTVLLSCYRTMTFSFASISAANQRKVYSAKVILRRVATEMTVETSKKQQLSEAFLKSSLCGHFMWTHWPALTSQVRLRYVTFAMTFVMCHPSSVSCWASRWSTS